MQSLDKYLQKHLRGEVFSETYVNQSHSRDGSLLQANPKVVVYPRDEDDIRKLMVFLHQLAKKGHTIPVTVRGGGTDLTGGAIGQGVVLNTSAHLNKIIGNNERRGLYEVQPGYNLSNLEKVFKNFEQFLPPIPAMAELATVGGAVANNSYNRYSLKYGFIGNYIKRLRVVLSNGDVIECAKLPRSKVLKKLTLDNLEGDIYREVDRLFFHVDSPFYYQKFYPGNDFAKSQRYLSCYNFKNVCFADGSLDLTPLFVGAQGTLGIITAIELQTLPFFDCRQVILLKCNNLEDAFKMAKNLIKLKPAALSLINGSVLAAMAEQSPGFLKDYQDIDKLEAILLVEFDESSHGKNHKKVKLALRNCQLESVGYDVFEKEADLDNLERLRSGLSLIACGSKQFVLPGFMGAYIPLDNLSNFYKNLKALMTNFRQPLMVFGEIGFGNFNVMVNLDLNNTQAKQRYLDLLDKYYQLVIDHGGKISTSGQEGVLLGHFLKRELTLENYQLSQTLKGLFDPYDILNPQAKLGSEANLNSNLVNNDDWRHFNNYLLRLF